MKKNLLLFMVVFCLTGKLLSQSSSASWPLTNPTNGGTGFNAVTAGQVTAENEYLKNMEVNQYTGGNNSQRTRIIGNSWPANQTTQFDTVYVQFTVSPQTNYAFLVDSLNLKIGAASTNTFKSNIWFSKDSTFTSRTQVAYTTGMTNNYLISSGLSFVNAFPNLLVNPGEKFYLRIYPWNEDAAIKTGKYLCLQDVNIFGKAQAIPVSASVIWPLTTNENPVISGLLNAGPETFGANLYKYDFSLVSGAGVNAVRITTISHDWQAETSANFTRYVQYAVSPLIGGTFTTDSISFKLGANFSNNLKAAVYYSEDSTFTTKTALITDTALVSSNLVPFKFAVTDTVATGETLYIRIYPYNTAAEGWAKLVYVSEVKISGNTTGLAIQLPTVTTTNVTYISTTFATSGGNISADGGGPITQRGVCWSTSPNPTVSDAHTSNGTGNGAFTSSVTGLTAGTTYYLRAYATNAGGTGYGSEVSFTTLAALVVPTLTTTAASSIQVTTAISGGSITNWGGSAVTAKGVCWSTTANPTVSGSHTTDGTDIGSFTSGITGLNANTIYYLRSYAINSTGTGYGNELTFTTQTPQRDTTVIVAKNGSGNYTTVQAAFRDVPANYTGKWTIFVKRGIYFEKDTLTAGKVNVILLGEDRDSTVITFNDYADSHGPSNPGTSGSFTIAIDANDFVAKNITFQNTYSPQAGVSGTQAVALRVNGDRQEYINCKLLGYQDTYYTWGGSGTCRTYHKNCYIEGTVDFIFGRNIVVFDSCTIRVIRNTGTLTAASTDATSRFGYVFRKCTILADSLGYDGVPISTFYLGRPWQSSPRTVFIKCAMPSRLNAAGWLAWNVNPGLYAEYQSYGPGSGTSQRVSWSSQLSDSAANTYSLSNIFAKSSAVSNLILYDWMPVNATQFDNPIPVELSAFDASAQGSSVSLSWKTATEKNNKGFDVQKRQKSEDRSQSKSASWETVSFVTGNGTTTETKNYSYTENNVSSGIYLYRLKQIDLDGTYKYSKEIEVEVSLPKKFELQQNYPNPFNPTTMINFQVPVETKVTIKVYDILGKEVTTLVNEKKEPGIYRIEFNASKLASGLYIYQIVTDNFVQSKKMMLLK